MAISVIENASLASGTITQTNLTTAVIPLGVGQTLTNVVGSRALNTTYTNSTGRPIFVSVTTAMANGSPLQVTVAGFTFNATSGFTNGAQSQISFIVPNGVTYSASSANVSSLSFWVELR
jgi:hypothetical protein